MKHQVAEAASTMWQATSKDVSSLPSIVTSLLANAEHRGRGECKARDNGVSNTLTLAVLIPIRIRLYVFF